MKRLRILLILSVITKTAFAQHIFDKNVNTYLFGLNNADKSVMAGTTFEVNPYLNMDYPKVFLLLQYHDNFKEYSNSLASENKAGLVLNNYISIKPGLEIGKVDLGFTFRNFYDQQISFTKDFFDLVHQGNSPLAGRPLSLAPLIVQSMQFQSFGLDFSFSYLKELKSLHKYGFSINLVRGVSFYDLDTRSGELFTSQSGDSIYAGFGFDYRQSDPAGNEWYSTNGVGATVDLFYSYQSIEGKNAVFIELNNLGFISWNSRSKYFEIDTSLNYTGFDIVNQNPFQGKDFFLDTFLNLEEGGVSDNFFQWLTPSLKLVFIHHLNPDKKIIIGTDYFINGYTIPAFYGSMKFMQEKTAFQPGIILDRYGKPGLFFLFNYNILDKLNLNIGSNHIEGFFYKFNGQSVFANLSYQF
jgi:hypothetical protein